MRKKKSESICHSLSTIHPCSKQYFPCSITKLHIFQLTISTFTSKSSGLKKIFRKMGVTIKSLLTMCDVLRNTPANPTNQFQIRHIGNDTAKLDRTFIDFVINYKHAEQNYKAVFCKSL